MSERTRIGVLVSGHGSNLAALLEAAAEPDYPGEIALVISNRKGVGALDVARNWKVPSLVMPTSDYDGSRTTRDAAMVAKLKEAKVQLVVCAGYNMVLSEMVLAAFADAIINVHPSLLPAFGGGMHAIEDALEAGVKITGCTVQFLTPGQPDGGPIILQSAVSIAPDESVESLRAKIHEQEWRLLPQAASLWCQGRLVREGKIVRIRNGNPQLTTA